MITLPQILGNAVSSVTVSLGDGLTVSYHPTVVTSLRQLMAHIAEGDVSQRDVLARLAFQNFSETYLTLHSMGLLLGPDKDELASFHKDELASFDKAVGPGDQVKMPTKIELTALGRKLNEAGSAIYDQATMTSGDYARLLDGRRADDRAQLEEE